MVDINSTIVHIMRIECRCEESLKSVVSVNDFRSGFPVMKSLCGVKLMSVETSLGAEQQCSCHIQFVHTCTLCLWISTSVRRWPLKIRVGLWHTSRYLEFGHPWCNFLID